MSRYIFTLSLFLLTLSCNQASQTEKDYIRNLEEKNRLLEQELDEAKRESEPNNTSNRKQKKITPSAKYFTIGSTEDEVVEIMGDPTRLLDMNSIGKRFYYDLSVVVFEKGIVVSYDNTDRNLKVRVKR